MKVIRTNRRYRLALLLDRRVGPLLCALLLVPRYLLRRARTPRAPGEVRSILLVKMWGMGSLVLASVLFEEIRRTYPGARIDVLTLRENLPVLELYPDVGRRIAIDFSKGAARFLIASLGTLRRLRRERYDLLLDLEFFTRFTALYSFLVRARWSHGFSAKGNWRGKLHDVEIPFNAYSHVTANFLTLLRGRPMDPSPAPGTEGLGRLPPLAPDPAAWARCEALLARSPAWRPGHPIVVVNPNAGDMALERRWPPARIAELLRRFAAGDGDSNIVLIGSAAERPHVESIVAMTGLEDRLIDISGRAKIPEIAALFSRASVVLTSDSGPLHIAAAAGAPTVALFGPETPVLYGPLVSRGEQRHIVHYRKLACSPCMFVHNNKYLSCWFAEAECMTGILPAEVHGSILDLLGRPPGSGADPP